MMLTFLNNTLQQTLIFFPLAIGVYLSYDILMVTDLSVEGTFVLGAALFARLNELGVNQFLNILISTLGGIIIGIAVTVMQRVAKINSLIAGILAVFMLYSINFDVMNRPNISLLDSHIFLQYLQDYHSTGLTFFLLGFSLFLCFCMYLFLHSQIGLHCRAFGSSPHLLKKLGKNPALYLAIGLSLSNGLAALCGIMTAQLGGYADINMGLGMALTAIGAVVIGKKLAEHIFPTRTFSALRGMVACFIGSFIYYLILNGFLRIGINPINLKLVLGLVLVVFLSTAHYTSQRGELYATAD